MMFFLKDVRVKLKNIQKHLKQNIENNSTAKPEAALFRVPRLSHIDTRIFIIIFLT